MRQGPRCRSLPPLRGCESCHVQYSGSIGARGRPAEVRGGKTRALVRKCARANEGSLVPVHVNPLAREGGDEDAGLALGLLPRQALLQRRPRARELRDRVELAGIPARKVEEVG